MVSLKEMAPLDAERAPPAWLSPLLETMFFEPCPEHPAIRSTRNCGCNFFCTQCAGAHALCSGCLAADHAGHQIIQIRKSSYHYVVKVAEIEHLLSVSQVQTYLINGELAVFLDKRTILGQGKPGAARCEECGRGLQDMDCLFCSLGCKPRWSCTRLRRRDRGAAARASQAVAERLLARTSSAVMASHPAVRGTGRNYSTKTVHGTGVCPWMIETCMGHGSAAAW